MLTIIIICIPTCGKRPACPAGLYINMPNPASPFPRRVAAKVGINSNNLTIIRQIYHFSSNPATKRNPFCQIQKGKSECRHDKYAIFPVHMPSPRPAAGTGAQLRQYGNIIPLLRNFISVPTEKYFRYKGISSASEAPFRLSLY